MDVTYTYSYIFYYSKHLIINVETTILYRMAWRSERNELLNKNFAKFPFFCIYYKLLNFFWPLIPFFLIAAFYYSQIFQKRTLPIIDLHKLRLRAKPFIIK